MSDEELLTLLKTVVRNTDPSKLRTDTSQGALKVTLEFSPDSVRDKETLKALAAWAAAEAVIAY